MKNFINSSDIQDYNYLLGEINKCKNGLSNHKSILKNKILGLIFFNPSLRTRLSTQKAAINLGLKSIVMNFKDDGWQLELDDNIIMSCKCNSIKSRKHRSFSCKEFKKDT